MLADGVDKVALKCTKMEFTLTPVKNQDLMPALSDASSVANDTESFVEVVTLTSSFAPRLDVAHVVKKTRAPVVSAGGDAPSKNNDDDETVSSPVLSDSDSGIMHVIRKISYGHGFVGLAALEAMLGIME